ncbi:2,3-bisphosphoglycerate-dependent phosphoglycerate mutase [Shigella flexneri]
MTSRLRGNPTRADQSSERLPGHDPRYAETDRSRAANHRKPGADHERVVPFWNETVLPRLKSGERVIIAAHGNSLRALVKYLDNMGEVESSNWNIPTRIRWCMSWTRTSSQ